MTRICEGRVVIVTGAGRGIGREHALLLAAHGANVVVNDLGSQADGTGQDISPAQKVVDEIKAAGGSAVANGSDVSCWTQAHELIQQAITTFGKLDVLVNNAGILRDRMLVNMTEDEWDSVIKVHLKGTFAPMRHAIDYWRDQTKSYGRPVSARIINTSSASGIYGNVGQANYGTAKMGITALTIIASRELEKYGVTVNAIAPIAQTRLTERLRDVTPEEAQRRDPKWVSPLVCWLASEQSQKVTGRVFEAGGGIIAVAEAWRRGPTMDQIDDPLLLGDRIRDLVARARPNVAVNGKELSAA
jgi:NAD(P)-dependent dehydrogenase (short-subunit alcohol dehydrogenase family)